MAKLLWTDCTKETHVADPQFQLECRGESASSSVTDELSEETNLLLTTSRDDDRLTAVNNFPRDIFTHVEKLAEGIFGEVSVVLY